MAQKPNRRIDLAQNFLRSPMLAHRLLEASSITSLDTVYEIGPGRGTITAELARTACRVIAVEKDPQLVRFLRKRFGKAGNVQILEGDFLRFRIPEKEYKVFANIPYNLTANIVRKILYSQPAADEAYLIVQKEAAEKFSGSPQETLFSVLAKAAFELEIVYKLRRTDFIPAPGVDSVLLHIHRRSPPLIDAEDVSLYRRFVRFGFERWRKNLKLAFKPIFTYEQWKHLARDLQFPIDARPTELTLEQWLGLFDSFKRRVPAGKRAYLLDLT